MEEQQIPTSLTPDQEALVRRSLIDKCNELYNAFKKGVMDMPMHPYCKQKALEGYDVGYLWTKEGLSCLQIGVAQPTPPDSTPADGSVAPLDESVAA